MDITKTLNKIIINRPNTFNSKHILDSGQMFRYNFDKDHYEVISKGLICELYTYEDRIEIITTEPNYFYNFFDLDTDYNEIINTLNNEYGLFMATDYGKGIRILNQDPYETIINFIISSNNNIPRIKGIIDRLCRVFGSKVNKYYAFPTPEEMANSSEDKYDLIKAGYRAKYLYNTACKIANGFDIDIVYQMDTDNGRKYLMQLDGIGNKVADCILLFAYHKTDVFPIDTWTEKVYLDEYNNHVSRKIMSEYFVNKYKMLSGYAQQYLYYYKRNR